MIENGRLINSSSKQLLTGLQQHSLFKLHKHTFYKIPMGCILALSDWITYFHCKSHRCQSVAWRLLAILSVFIKIFHGNSSYRMPSVIQKYLYRRNKSITWQQCIMKLWIHMILNTCRVVFHFSQKNSVTLEWKQQHKDLKTFYLILA